jgi:mannose-1-phosphate guanylyltransferase
MGIGSILFAAGEGKRLRPLTNSLPKPAIPLLDIPLGTFGLAALLRTAPPVIVNASRNAAVLEASFRRTVPEGWELFDEGHEGFGTAGTIAALAERIDGPIVVHNGDLLTDLDPAAVLDAHGASGAGITLAARMVDHGADVQISGDVVNRFIDRRRESSARGAQYLGVAVIESSVARSIPKQRPLGLGESVFGPLADQGLLRVHLHDGYALDVGTIGRFLRASDDCLYGTAPVPPVEWPGRVIEVDSGKAYIGPGVIGSRSSFGAGAIVLRDSFVDPGAHIQRSVVWPRELVPEGEVVRDAVWLGGRALSR